MLTVDTPFRLESEMLAALTSDPRQLFASSDTQHSATLIEPYIAGVIPDLLFGFWRGTPAPVRLKSLTNVEAHLIALVARKSGVPGYSIAHYISIAPRQLESSLDKLLRTGFIKKNPEGCLTLGDSLELSRLEIVAIEMKLTRWREALLQAASYKEFADRSYVVLDGNQVHVNEQTLEAFRKKGVGLVLQRGNLLETILAAVIAKPLTVERIVATHKIQTQLRLESLTRPHADATV